MKIPRIMIAAAGSGSGKTTITCALLKLLSDRGQNIAAFKCGPDYIDPMFHQNALGVPSKNLDTFFTDENLTRRLFMEDAAGRDLSIIEGVMGLFDGLGGIKEEASSYHLAKVMEVPIILVVNAHGMGRSLLALISGFLSYDTQHLIKGIILNKVSPSFYKRIKPEIETNLPIKVLGFFPNTKEIQMDCRYLGLKLPGETENSKTDCLTKINKAAAILSSCVDVPLILKIAKQAGDFNKPYTEEAGFSDVFGGRNKIPLGIAMDEAFCFYYRDNLKLLERMGVELIPFSLLHDTALPKGIQGILLGGGYPELYADKLSKNQTMRNSLKDAVAGGMPSIAECGGFLYLHERLEIQSQKSYEMAGVLKGKCFDTGKSVRFGYVEIKEKKSTFLEPGKGIKGHEFHYFDSTDNGQDCMAVKPVSGISYRCVHESIDSFWGFVHLYYYSNPFYVKHFIERMKAYGSA